MNLYSWDKISDEIQREDDADDLRKRTEEIGMLYSRLLENGVAVLATDRHFGLECWAEDVVEAHQKFLQFPYYAKMQEN